MRLAQLSRAAGISPATVKWYLRIGLLHRGEATAANQARYNDSHVRRLRLIRALVEVGGLSTDAVRDILAAIDDPDRSVADVLAAAHKAGSGDARSGAPAASAALVDDFVRHRGWQVRADSPARHDLAAVLNAIAGLRPPADTSVDADAPDVSTAEAVFSLMDPYADSVERLAEAEIANAPNDLNRDQLVERVVAGTVLLERALTALRRLAQEHYAAGRYRQ